MTREEEQLRDLLRGEVRKASEEAIKLGSVASADVQRLESLSKLLTIAQELERPAPEGGGLSPECSVALSRS